MGCDYTIRIQVRHGSHWIDVVFFGTNTRCGGGPLIATVIDFRNQDKNGARGDYGVEHPLASVETAAAHRFIMTQHLDNVGKTSCVAVNNVPTTSNNNQDETNCTTEKDENITINDANAKGNAIVSNEDEDEDEEEEYQKDEDFMYYSKEQFAQFAELVQKCEEDRRGEPVYGPLLRPVALWCDMARSMLPMPKENEILDDL